MPRFWVCTTVLARQCKMGPVTEEKCLATQLRPTGLIRLHRGLGTPHPSHERFGIWVLAHVGSGFHRTTVESRMMSTFSWDWSFRRSPSRGGRKCP